jgi:spermidine/putrescine transport system ATP-binding protein
MNAGRFEQVGTPQELYYQPRTPFVAGFVGTNNRLKGIAARADEQSVELASEQSLTVRARPSGAIAAGNAVEAFVRPEVVSLARDAAALAAPMQRFVGRVESLLFDGANSAVLLREERTGTEFRVALPQTGELADLREGEQVAFGFDPQRVVCFEVSGT